MIRFRIFFIFHFFQVIFVKNNKSATDVELVFQLQKYFTSDLILIITDDNNNDDLYIAKEFNKYSNKKMQGFIGGIDINKNFDQFTWKLITSPYHDIIVVSYGGTKLIKKLTEINVYLMPKLMASAIWIVFIQEDITNELKNFYIPFNCKFLIVKKIDALNYDIEDVYQISENYPQAFTKFASWKNRKLEIFGKDFYGRRMDLKGKRITVAETFLKQYVKEYHYLWEVFSERMNFSIIWDPRNKEVLLPNGTILGLFRDIYYREIDGSASNYIVSNSWMLDDFDTIFPTMKMITKFYVKPNIGLNWGSYVAPFTKNVWLSIFGWILLSSVIMHLIVKFKSYNTSEFSLFMVIRAHFNQAGVTRSSSISFYISYILPYLLAIILTQCYSGTLSSYLAVKQRIVPFNNLKEIVEDGTYKLTALLGTYNEFYFENNADPLPTAVREKHLFVRSEDLPQNTDEGFQQICENRFVFVCTSSNLLIKGKCEISELDEIIFEHITGIFVWKGFPYKDVMTELMKKIQFAGLAKISQKDIIYSNEETGIFKPLSMDVIFPIFLVYTCAAVLSFFVLLFEFMCKKN